MCIVKGGVTHSFLCSDLVHPKSVWCYFQPLSDITISSFDYGIAHGPIGMFDYAISSWVISWNPYVIDVVCLGQPIKCRNHSWHIVSDDFLTASPSAKYLLKYEHPYGPSIFFLQFLPFWPINKWAAGLDDVTVMSMPDFYPQKSH